MKKLLTAIAIIATVAVHAAEFKFPGWDCKDLALIQQQAALTSNNWNKALMDALLDFAQNGAPETIGAAYDRIEGAVGENIACSTDTKLTFAKQWAIENGKPGIVQYCIDNPSSFDLYMVLWKLISIEPETGYRIVADRLLKYQHEYEPNYVIHGINFLNRQAIALDKTDAEVFDLFKKLNRVYTAQLIKDKEKWGGIVAQIRTMMETYK